MGVCESTETHLSCTKEGDRAFNNNRIEEALDAYSRAIEINPNYYLAYYGRAQALARQMRFEEAHCDANMALQVNPNFHMARFLKANCFDCTEDYDLAVMERSRIPRPILHRLEQDTNEQVGRRTTVTSFNASTRSDDYEVEENEWQAEMDKQQNRFNYIRGRRGQYVVKPHLKMAATRYHAESQRRRTRFATMVEKAH